VSVCPSICLSQRHACGGSKVHGSSKAVQRRAMRIVGCIWYTSRINAGPTVRRSKILAIQVHGIQICGILTEPRNDSENLQCMRAVLAFSSGGRRDRGRIGYEQPPRCCEARQGEASARCVITEETRMRVRWVVCASLAPPREIIAGRTAVARAGGRLLPCYALRCRCRQRQSWRSDPVLGTSTPTPNY